MPEVAKGKSAKKDYVKLAVDVVNKEEADKYSEAKKTVAEWQSVDVGQKAKMEQQFRDAQVVLRVQFVEETVEGLQSTNDTYPDKVVIVLADYRKRSFLKANL
jgi:hypothetical protein